jgi:aspartyl-tRNA(Asn)/glutamyl-tRNA(Gln) amidotransferase subunit B
MARTWDGFEAVIGLEVHAQLLTRSKVFCGCSADFGGEPNTRVCPICLGFPGVLPVLNRKALEFTIRTALALNCKIARFSKFDRKNYFYPDLPKNYQISQYDMPISYDGYLDIEVDGEMRRIGIIRVHLEEETGKNIHLADEEKSLVDFNRTGVPLIEIVSKPDMRSPEEAKEYLMRLRDILMYIDVCNGNMEEGSFRCDANVSVRPVGSPELGTKTEVKNMNSFKNVQRALEYEIRRQVELIKAGKKVVQETRLWDVEAGVTRPMRTKEYAHDYRYFPEPDLVLMEIDPEWVEEIRRSLPELPAQRLERFIRDYNIPEYDARILTSRKALADYFERCVQCFPKPKVVSNWIMVDILGALSARGMEIEEFPIPPERLADLLKLVEDGTINQRTAKDVFSEMLDTGKGPEEIVRSKGLTQISDEGTIAEIVEKVLAENMDAVESYRKGKEKAFGFLVGQVMRETRGKANPQIVNRILKEKIGR